MSDEEVAVLRHKVAALEKRELERDRELRRMKDMINGLNKIIVDVRASVEENSHPINTDFGKHTEKIYRLANILKTSANGVMKAEEVADRMGKTRPTALKMMALLGTDPEFYFRKGNNAWKGGVRFPAVIVWKKHPKQVENFKQGSG